MAIIFTSIPGNSISDWAKMIGMTPPWLTRSGRYCRCPPYMRRPRVCLACWMGMRRCACVIRIVPATTNTNDAARKIIFWAFIALALPVLVFNFRRMSDTAKGMRAMIPAMMMKLTPLPSPYSSICSPSHIRKMHPAVSENSP